MLLEAVLVGRRVQQRRDDDTHQPERQGVHDDYEQAGAARAHAQLLRNISRETDRRNILMNLNRTLVVTILYKVGDQYIASADLVFDSGEFR